MTELAALNVRITGDSGDLQAELNAAGKSLNTFDKRTQTSARNTTALTGSFGRLSNMSGQTKAQLQNVGFQLQDIAVQLQGGTRASVVFAQQGSQLLSIFGPMGALFGTLAAVGIPALAFAFSQASDNVANLETNLSDLEGILDGIEGSLKTHRLSIDDMIRTYGAGVPIIRSLNRAILELQVDQARSRMNDLSAAIGDTAEQLAAWPEDFAADLNLKALRRIEGAFGLVGDEAQRVANLFYELTEAEDFDSQAQILATIYETLRDLGVPLEKMPKDLKNAVEEAGQLVDMVERLKVLMEDAAAASGQIGMNFGDPRALAGLTGAELLPEYPDGNTDTDTDTGAGVRRNPIEAQLESVRNALMTQEEAQIASFQRQQEVLRSALEQQLLTRQEYNSLMEDAQSQHSAAMAQIDAYRYGSGLQMAGQFFGDMASAMQGGNDKMMRLAQTFGAFEALINAYRAYNQTLADPSLPFFAKFAAAASVLASGMRAVSAIKGMGGGGASSGGAAAIGAAGSAGATQAPAVSRNVAISLQGGDIFSRDQVLNLINAINESVEDGAIIRVV